MDTHSVQAGRRLAESGGLPVVVVVMDEAAVLIGGEPGSGKSGLANLLAARATLSAGSRLDLVDGKGVELDRWREYLGPIREYADPVVVRDGVARRGAEG
jgi:hypothetical protein